MGNSYTSNYFFEQLTHNLWIFQVARCSNFVKSPVVAWKVQLDQKIVL